MKVFDARVKWYSGFINNPVFEIWVDRIPEWSEKRFSLLNRTTYFSNTKGCVTLLSGTPGVAGAGFYGSSFKLQMTDQSVVTLVGPFDIGPTAVNHETPLSSLIANGFCTQCAEAVATSDFDSFIARRSSTQIKITLDLTKQAARCAGVWLAQLKTSSGYLYIPTFNRTPPKGSAGSSILSWRFVYPVTSDWINVKPVKYRR